MPSFFFLFNLLLTKFFCYLALFRKLEDLSKVIDQNGLEFDSLPSLNTKEDLNEINDFLTTTLNGFDLPLDLTNSYNSNAQLISLPLNYSTDADANTYLSLDDNNTVDTNVLYPANYPATVNPPVVTSSNLQDSAYLSN